MVFQAPTRIVRLKQFLWEDATSANVADVNPYEGGGKLCGPTSACRVPLGLPNILYPGLAAVWAQAGQVTPTVNLRFKKLKEKVHS